MSRKVAAFIFIVVFTGCKQDAPVDTQSLSGKWNIHTALRNEKVTKTLEGGYMLFEGDTSIITNIWGDLETYKFTLDGRSLTTTEGEPPLKLTLEKLTTDSLILGGKIKYFDMEFQMVRDTAK